MVFPTEIQGEVSVVAGRNGTRTSLMAQTGTERGRRDVGTIKDKHLMYYYTCNIAIWSQLRGYIPYWKVGKGC